MSTNSWLDRVYLIERTGQMLCSLPRSAVLRLALAWSIREWWGVGRGDGRLRCWVGAHPRKIRTQYHGYKHT